MAQIIPFQDKKPHVVVISALRIFHSSQPSTPHQGYFHNRPKSAVGSAVVGPTKLDVPHPLATNRTNGNVGVKGRAAFDDFQAGRTFGMDTDRAAANRD